MLKLILSLKFVEIYHNVKKIIGVRNDILQLFVFGIILDVMINLDHKW